MLNLGDAVLKDIFDYSSDAIFILDREWKIMAMNGTAEAVTGWDKAEAVSMRLCTELFLCHDMEGNQLCDSGCPKESVMITKNPSDELEVKILARSGHPVILPGIAIFIPAKGDSSYVAVIIRNEVEKQMLEEKIMAGQRLDPLTQLYHRQYFEDLYTIEAKRAQRHGGDVTLLMLDVEKLREINSSSGARTGDMVLKGIGNVIKDTIREVDVAGRYGDDEYIILLYGVDEARAQSFMQRLRDNVQKFNKSQALPAQVKLNMYLMVANSEFDAVLGKMKEMMDEHKGTPL